MLGMSRKPFPSDPLRYHRYHMAMRGEPTFMDGFDAGDREPLSGEINVEPVTRDQLANVCAAISLGATPEEITGYLTDGFPTEVAEMFDRPHEREEMDAHVGVLLAVLQGAVTTPAKAAA